MPALYNPFKVRLIYQPIEEVLTLNLTFGRTTDGGGPVECSVGLLLAFNAWLGNVFSQNVGYLSSDTRIIGYYIYGTAQDPVWFPKAGVTDVIGEGSSGAMPSDSYAQITLRGSHPNAPKPSRSTLKFSGIPKPDINNGRWTGSVVADFAEDVAPFLLAPIAVSPDEYRLAIDSTLDVDGTPTRFITQVQQVSLNPIVGSMKDRIPNRTQRRGKIIPQP